jgi:hypothetical protein
MKTPLTLLTAYLLLALPHASHTFEETPRVWFSPDNETPDLLEMFTRPDLWQTARSHIKIIKLGPQHFELQSSLERNSLLDLQKVKAFEKLTKWGISLASEEGVVKEWDCTGSKAAKVTLGHIRNVRAAHGNISVIAMDEPLVSGLGACRLSLGDIATNTHNYMRDVERASFAMDGIPLIGDIEPYPSIPISTLESWIDALYKKSTRLAFFHLDIDINYVHVHQDINVNRDLRDLQDFLLQRKIPFGVIIWSGHDPVDSDEVYYRDAMELARLVKSSVHLPIEIVFQSWVHRSPIGAHCPANDPSLCGHKTVPLNLPEDDSLLYSHTRLVNDALAFFGEY